MASQPPTKPAGVARVVFKEIVPGDLRKFKAESNDADTGGGARDLRFRPYDEFAPIFRKLFPNVRRETRTREKKKATVEVFEGRFYWQDKAGKVQSKEATFEPPTSARPGEGRIPVVYTYPPLNDIPPTNEGRIVVLLVQRTDGHVWPAFATEKSLRSGEWDESVAKAILQCLDTERKGGQAARGYVDFEDMNRSWCDA